MQRMDKHHFKDETPRVHELEPSDLELLAAVRPHSDDLHQPEFASLRARLPGSTQLRAAAQEIEQFDDGVRAALHDARVPADLAERLIARLALSDDGAQQIEAEAVVEVAAESSAETVGRFRQRRAWWTIGIAASLLIAATAVWKSREPAPLRSEEISTLAQEDWQQQLGGDWIRAALPSGYKIPPLLEHFVAGWQKIVTSQRDAIAVRLIRDQQIATLFIIKGHIDQADQVPTSMPRQPQSTTGGFAMGYWQQQDTVNVLLVEGDRQTYQHFVPSGSDALAWLELRVRTADGLAAYRFAA
jgi:hypothetical protein